jgi:hypothetical protein
MCVYASKPAQRVNVVSRKYGVFGMQKRAAPQ